MSKTKWKLLVYLFLILSVCAFARITHTNGKEIGSSCPAPDLPKNQKLEKILDDLAYCESRNNDDIKVLDSNNQFSYGRFQYQQLTFERYIKEYNLLPNAEEAEYINFIHDGKVQRDLTRKILLDGGWRNWLNCGKAIKIEKRLREVSEARNN